MATLSQTKIINNLMKDIDTATLENTLVKELNRQKYENQFC